MILRSCTHEKKNEISCLAKTTLIQRRKKVKWHSPPWIKHYWKESMRGKEPEAYCESCAIIYAVWIVDSELPIWNIYSIK